MALGMLPPVVAEVVAEIGKYSTSMGKVKEEMGSLEAASVKMGAAGKVAATGLAIAIAGVGYESVKMAMGFDTQMEMIHTQAGASQAEVDRLKESVLALGPATGIGPEKLAEGLYHIESTGYRGQEALDILTASAHDAAIGLTDMDTMSNALAGTLSVGMKDITSAADAANYLNTTVGIGDMRMEKLAAAIGTGALPAFKSAGLGMIDFSASLATLTDNAVPADEAATRLRMTVALMAAPSGPAVKALKSIGLSATDLANDLHKPNGLLTAVMDLKHHLESAGLTAVEQNQVIEHAFGGGKTSGAILTMLEETDRLKSKYEALGTSATRAQSAAEAWAAQQKQFGQQWNEFTATLQATGIKIGNWLIPKLQAMFEWINKNGETVKILAIAIGGVLVVAIGAWTVALIQAAIANIAATWEILLIIAAVAALAAGIYILVKHWTTVWNWIKEIAGNVWHWLVDAWNWLLGVFKGAGRWFMAEMVDPVVRAWHWLVDAWHTVVHALEEAAFWILTKVILPIVNWVTNYLVRPIQIALKVFTATFEFAWGFLSVVFDDFRRGWDAAWHVIAGVISWAWNNVLKPIGQFILTYVIHPIAVAIDALGKAWDVAWAWMSARISDAWLGMKIVWGYIDKYVITPIGAAITWLGKEWDMAWAWMMARLGDAWAGMKVIWGFIDKYGITPVKEAIGALRDAWNVVWEAIKSAVSAAWNFIKPIFDKIGSAISSVRSGISDVVNAPGKAGQGFAHMLGFADGGVVPGPQGAPQLAVVHGGEQILSNDQLSSMGRGQTFATIGGGGAAGGGGGGDITLRATFVYPDGRQVRTEQLRYARRAGLSPAELYPSSVGALA